MKQLITSLGCIMLICATALFGQGVSTDHLIMEGKRVVKEGYDAYDKSQLLKARGLFERAVSSDPAHQWARYHQVYTDYRLIVYFMQQEDTEKFERYTDAALNEGRKLIEDYPNNAEAKALMCSIYGMKISGNWSLAPVLGPKSQKLIGEAMELAPENPRVLLQAGISKYNTPAFFGGDKEEAVTLFRQAIALFEQEQNEPGVRPDWGYPDACAWLGIAYTRDEQYDKAIAIYEKALATHPEFSWIKSNLLPEVKRKISPEEASQ